MRHASWKAAYLAAPAFLISGSEAAAEVGAMAGFGLSVEVQLALGALLVILAVFTLRLLGMYRRSNGAGGKLRMAASDAQRLEQVLQLSRVGHWTYDIESEKVEWDDTTCDIHEVEPGREINLQTALGFYLPESREKLQKELMRAITKRESFDTVAELISAKGNKIWARAIGDCRIENGAVVGFTGVFHDITDYKNQEDSLRTTSDRLQDALADRDAAEKRFFDIAAISGEWFWEQDELGRFTFLSESYERRTGGDASVFIGKTRTEILASRPKIDDGADWTFLDDRIARRLPFSDFVYRNIGVTGDVTSWVRISGAPFYHLDGSFAGYRGVGSDVTDIFEARRRAEEASASKSRFLANMSHEIRTPLHGILGLAEELERCVDDPDAMLLIKNIRASGDQLRTVINDILDFSKIEAGKIDVERKPFLLSELIERLRALHEFRAEEKGLSLRISVEGDQEKARLGDAHRITQVLHNIVGNAVKFTERGEVHLSIDARDPLRLSMTVEDTGIGMSESALSRVFVGFDQGDDTTSRRYGGTGLGMPIARSLTVAMGGGLRVESRLGVGTAVHLSISAALTDQAGEPDAKAPTLPSGTFKILAVDDNATNRMLFDLLLKRSGFLVRIAEGGNAAVAAVEEEAFDLYLMDISMPEMDGIEALTKIREIERRMARAQAPALAVTANAMRHQVEEYLDVGFDGHVAKPIQRDELLAKIADCLSGGDEGAARTTHASADLQ